MSLRPELQLERLVDAAMKHNSHEALEAFLEDEHNEGISPKCSRQFIKKLDNLINRELSKGNIKHVSLALTCLHVFGRTLTTQNGLGLAWFIEQGLIRKMVVWFEKAQKIWVEAGMHRSKELLNLAEDFMDALLVVHESNKEGNYQVTNSFLHHLCQLVAEGQIHILIQKEVIRKLNVILGKIPPELKKTAILSSAEIFVFMKKLASRMLECGDYDLQIALVEVLCRMTTRAQRLKLAPCWFAMDFVITAFSEIKDSDFETDCRKFLNLVNGIQGDRRRVFSYPCVEVFLDKHELLMPVDEKLEEFWIDFNIGSHSISFYCSVADEAEEGQWETVFILEDEVYSYTVKEVCNRKVLSLALAEPLHLNRIKGTEVFIHFSTSLDILQAVTNVFGTAKHKFVAKRSSSVVKTTVQVVMDEASSQAFVPESQVSSAPSVDKGSAGSRKISPKQTQHLGSQEGIIRDPPIHGTLLHKLQVATPAKRKVSESNTLVSSSSGRRMGMSPISSVLSASSLTSRVKVKPTLDMIKSSERKEGYDIRDLMIAKTSLSISPVRAQCLVRSEQDSTVRTSPENKLIRQESRSGAAAKSLHAHTSVEKMLEMTQNEQDSVEQVLAYSVGENTNMVPDTQVHDRTAKPVQPVQSTSEPSWRRVSVSKVQLPGERHFSNGLAAQPTSLPQAVLNGSCKQLISNEDAHCAPEDASCQQLHAQLTQRLEELLRDREQETQSVKKQVSNKQKGNRERAGRAPRVKGKAQQQGRDIPQKALKAAVVKNGSTAPNLQEGNCNRGLPIKANRTENGKEKKAEAAAFTGRMMSFISNQYKTAPLGITDPGSVRRWTTTLGNRSYLGKRSSLTSVEKGTVRHSGLLESSNQPNAPARPPEADVYRFHVETLEGDRGMKSSEHSIINSSSVLDSTSFSRTTKKVTRPVKASKQYVKKHLFSDTETDNKTDISWIRESSRKIKQKVVDYSRQHPQKLASASCKFPNLPSSSPMILEKQTKPKKKRQRKHNLIDEKKISPVINRASGRPQRTSAMFKSYKEPSESDSISLSETEKAKLATGKTERDVKTTQKINGRKKYTAEKLQARRQKESRTTCMASFTPSPPPTERMRIGEKSVALPKSSISPIHSLSMSPDCISSPPLEFSRQHKEVKASSYRTSLSSSSGKSSLLHTHSPVSQKPITPLLPQSRSLQIPRYSRQKGEAVYLKMHPSGPCSSLKRCAKPISSSTSEEEELGEKRQYGGRQKEQGGMLKPRKLFKPRTNHSEKDEACATEEQSVISSQMVSSCWEASVEGEIDLALQELSTPANLGSVCRQFSSELQRKLQIRSRQMDLYAKQSLKTIQQHLSSISKQMLQYRTQQLEKVKGALLEEIKDLEQDDSTLKNMEEELTTYWNKQCQGFHSIKEKGTHRLQHLRTIYSMDVSYSTEFEEQIFKSGMCLMKKDMKSIQDRLFRDMHEEELLSVRKGLQALFLTDRRL